MSMQGSIAVEGAMNKLLYYEQWLIEKEGMNREERLEALLRKIREMKELAEAGW